MVELDRIFRRYYRKDFVKFEKTEIVERLVNKDKSLLIRGNNKIFLINIEVNGNCKYDIFVENNIDEKIVIVILVNIKENSQFDIDIKFKAFGEVYFYLEIIHNSDSFSNVNIKGYIRGNVVILSKMVIPKESSNANTNLNEIFYINDGKIVTIPSLLVYNPTGKGSHASKIIKISEEEKFYLRSKGISDKEISKIIEESMFIKTSSNNSL